MSPSVKVTEIAPAVARITIDRPGSMNALNAEVRAQLSDGLDQILQWEALRALVVTGAGDKAFVVGADINELIDLTADESERLSLDIMEFHERLRALAIPVIASINGWCLGGGLELALACDLRIASQNARFGLPEVTLAIMPGGGGTARLSRLVGPALARAMCLTGEIIDAERALSIGLVTKVVPPDELEQETEALASRLAGYSETALAQIKSTLDAAEHTDLATAQRFEAKACAHCFNTEPQRTAMAAFLEKSKKR